MGDRGSPRLKSWNILDEGIFHLFFVHMAHLRLNYQNPYIIKKRILLPNFSKCFFFTYYVLKKIFFHVLDWKRNNMKYKKRNRTIFPPRKKKKKIPYNERKYNSNQNDDVLFLKQFFIKKSLRLYNSGTPQNLVAIVWFFENFQFEVISYRCGEFMMQTGGSRKIVPNYVQLTPSCIVGIEWFISGSCLTFYMLC